MSPHTDGGKDDMSSGERQEIEPAKGQFLLYRAEDGTLNWMFALKMKPFG